VIDPIRAGRDLNVDFIIDGNIKKGGRPSARDDPTAERF
jgi:hypothetical protein